MTNPKVFFLSKLEALSTASRLRSGFGFLMLLVVAMALSGAIAMLSMSRHMNQIVEVNNTRKDLANDLADAINSLAIQTRNITLLTELAEIKREMGLFEQSVTRHDKIQRGLVDALSQEEAISPARVLMAEITAASAKTLPNIKRAVKAGFEGSNVEATMILTTEVQTDESVWRSKVQQMLQLQRDETAAAVGDARTARTTALALGAFLMLVALVSGGMVSQWVVRNNGQMMAVIAEQNANLELRVTERTAQLQQKTNDINAMLQNMALGVCTVVPGNRIHPEHSSYLRTFSRMEDLADQLLLPTVLGRAVLSEDVRDQIATALSSVLGEDQMMFDFNSHLLPAEVNLEDPDGSQRVAQLQWSPITNQSGTVEKMLLIVQDVTHLRTLEMQAREQRAELESMAKVLKVPAGKFNEFIASAKRLTTESRLLINTTAQRSEAVIAHLFRNLHTVKGNARTFDLTEVSDPAHAAETSYDSLRKDSSVSWEPAMLLKDLDAVDAGIAVYSRINDDKLGRGGRAAEFVSGRGAFVAQDDLSEIQTSAAQLLRQSTEPQAKRLLTLLDNIGLATLDRIVSGTADAASALAAQLGKPMPKIELIGGGIGFRPELAEALKGSLIHIVRNAMDHGIESPEARKAAGKPETGTISVQGLRGPRHIELTIRDDGRGLNLQALLHKGRAAGLIAEGHNPSPAELAELIFHSGLTTAAELTEVSGRGVGMDAVRSFLQEVGARIEVQLDEAKSLNGFLGFALSIQLPLSSGLTTGAAGQPTEAVVLPDSAA